MKDNFELAKQIYDKWLIKMKIADNPVYDNEILKKKYHNIVDYASNTTGFWKNHSKSQHEETTTNKDFFISNFQETTSEVIQYENIKNGYLKSEFQFNEGNQIFLSAGKSGKLSFFLYDKNMWIEYLAMYLKLFYLGGCEYNPKIKIAFLGTIDIKHTLNRVARSFPKSQVGIFGLQEPFNIYSEKILDFNPDIVVGFSSAVKIASKNLLDKISPKLVITNTDYLADDSRRFIEEQWGSKIMNTFTMTEAGILAFECLHGNLHVNEEHIFIKKINSQLTLTNVINKIQPFIHYTIPDFIRVLENKTCTCSLNTQLLEVDKGRENDVLKISDGQDNTLNIHPILLRSVLDNVLGIINYDFTIKSESLVFNIKIEKEYNPENIKKSIINGFLKYKLDPSYIDEFSFNMTTII